MKNFVLIIVSTLVVFATARACVFTGFGPTQLTVKITDSRDGEDLTAETRFLVGYVASGDRHEPTLGNVTLIREESGNMDQFIVPPRTLLAIFVFAPKLDPVLSRVQLDAGEQRLLEISVTP